MRALSTSPAAAESAWRSSSMRARKLMLPARLRARQRRAHRARASQSPLSGFAAKFWSERKFVAKAETIRGFAPVVPALRLTLAQ